MSSKPDKQQYGENTDPNQNKTGQGQQQSQPNQQGQANQQGQPNQQGQQKQKDQSNQQGGGQRGSEQ